ncbi:uncharacterized protein LOC8065301 isoform X3 [Sorghum bicolor]|uniref:uncharacterized protein LOC8065301 isoform X3 n=1 Tax=Sorghum bicolor TaxID=4558 RepID=UPI0001A893C5|nr:uncharacterized protein LOC8065301 isoform X3 [Sorghum bicolor]|eukprot:XP_002441604.1 uncharacterized protein LOC8065301 isoform X3 [Sorghum bicolor]
MAAAVHCSRWGTRLGSRAYVPMSFLYGSGTSSTKKPSCHKCCALVELTLPHKELRKLSQLIRYREFVLPQSSLKELACQQLAHGMDEQWSYHSSHSASVSSGQYSVKKSTVKEVQDRQHCQPQGVAYFTDLSEKEIERRRKIGAANKGKVPWTKGRKWSEEHKKLIKQRTAEALRDPKVRKKMLGHRQLHRQTSKDKISAALRTIWERRIVSVQSRQKVLQIWSNSIAEAAKNGDHSQNMLHWDSYETIKSEMISMFLWNKERGQIIKKLKKAVAKITAKRLQAARRIKEQATGTKTLKPEKKLKPEKMLLQNSDRQPTRVVVSAKPKLKERLAKWHGRKKELETVISLRARKRGLRKAPRRQMAAESLEAPSTPAAGTSVI